MSPALRTKAPCAVQLHDGATLCQVMQKPLKALHLYRAEQGPQTCAGPALMLCSVWSQSDVPHAAGTGQQGDWPTGKGGLTFDPALLLHPAGEVGDMDTGLATPLEVYQGLAAEGYQISYRRVPLSRERTPEAADLDVLHQQLMMQPVGECEEGLPTGCVLCCRVRGPAMWAALHASRNLARVRPTIAMW